MKTKIVLWGSNDKDEKLLLAIQLVAKESLVKIHCFPAEETTEAFYNQMMNLWRNDGAVIFPENHILIERELSITEDLIPPTLKVDKPDILSRAKSEWHFVVLSAKMFSNYQSEIEDFRERIEELSNFDTSTWEEMKTFWNKVQQQVREKNLFVEHANELRHNTNELFTKMKDLKRVLDDEFRQISGSQAQGFISRLEEIEKKIEEGLGLQPLFNELKNIQNTFKNTEFTRSDRSKVWRKLDAAFKTIKEKKFGRQAGDKSPIDRIMRRYNGLIAAIQKMESSINRDKKERDFQERKIQTTDGQLEMQIRQAKMTMITERIRSKDEKLNEMLKTKEKLEKKIETEKAKQPKNEPASSKADQHEKSDEAKKDSDKAENKENSDTMTEAISATMGEAISDVVDTVKAIAEVVGEKIEDAVVSLKSDEEE